MWPNWGFSWAPQMTENSTANRELTFWSTQIQCVDAQLGNYFSICYLILSGYKTDTVRITWLFSFSHIHFLINSSLLLQKEMEAFSLPEGKIKPKRWTNVAERVKPDSAILCDTESPFPYWPFPGVPCHHLPSISTSSFFFHWHI